jgi:hypothetical protein
MTIRLRNLVLLVGVSATVTALGAQQATAPAPAQPPTAKGVIVGTIVDAATNQPIPSATVNVSPDGNRTRTTVVADDKGRYVFSEAATTAFDRPSAPTSSSTSPRAKQRLASSFGCGKTRLSPAP